MRSPAFPGKLKEGGGKQRRDRGRGGRGGKFFTSSSLAFLFFSFLFLYSNGTAGRNPHPVIYQKHAYPPHFELVLPDNKLWPVQQVPLPSLLLSLLLSLSSHPLPPSLYPSPPLLPLANVYIYRDTTTCITPWCASYFKLPKPAMATWALSPYLMLKSIYLGLLEIN